MNTQDDFADLIDVQLVQQSEQKCNGFTKCNSLERIMEVLLYYNKVSTNNPQQFIDFCEKYYSKQYLEDYTHFISVHSKQSFEIEPKCVNIDNCLMTQRHYRDRTINENENSLPNKYIDIFDTIHFYICHMKECALRVTINNNDIKQINETDDINNCRDSVIAAIQKEIETKKEQSGSFKRLDNTKNSKFNIMQNNNYYQGQKYDDKQDQKYEETEIKSKENTKKASKSVWKTVQSTFGKYFGNKNEESKEEECETTFRDEMLDNICIKGVAENTFKNVKEYLLSEQYDTDCIENDIDIYNQVGICNLFYAANNNFKFMQQIKNFFQMVNISSVAFSTGFVFWYWPYYKNISDEKLQKKQSWSSLENDFGGYSIRDLFVKKHFKSLKEEIINCKFININQFNEKVIKKGNEYMLTEKCKKIKCIEHDTLHFGIKYNANLKNSHLYALILYCDFTDFCCDFSATFRKTKWNESVKSVRERNRKYFFCSKNLREVIQYYGYSKADLYKRTGESGPFYCGLSFVLNIPEFCIRLNGPTSTSVRPEVAIRFARKGMIIQLNNTYYPASQEIFFNCSWLSAFPEEDERLFCGGRFKIHLETVVIMKTYNNYHRFFGAFYKFDKLLSGQVSKMGITQDDYEIVSWFIKFILGESQNNKKFDQFVKDTFELFTQQKRQIVLNLEHLCEVKNKHFIGLIMNKIETTYDGQKMKYDIKMNEIRTPNDNTNLFKSCLFHIFGNLKEIIIYTIPFIGSSVYSFNIFSLLAILEEVSLPKSFKRIIIKDKWSVKWLRHVFSSKIKETFASKGLKIELKKKQGQGKDEHWMIISIS